MLVLNYYEVVSPALATKLAKLNPQEVAVCSVVRAELFFGAFRSNNREQALAMVKEFLDNFQSLPFDDHAAEI